ncbi:MAG: branched-chain amino acid ABC transporter permease [Phycisphaeraceae bacterium]
MDALAGILASGLNSAIGPTAIVFALAAIGLNVHYGFTGLLNFGQVGFMLVGAYGMAISVSIHGMPFWAGILFGMLAAVVLALLLGFPTLRLRTDYLAISTIAAAEIIRFMARSTGAREITGGPFGIPSQVGGAGFDQTWNAWNPFPPGRYSLGWLQFTHTRLWVVVAGWTLVALLTLLVWMLMRSPWGRVLKSIREDEDAARALGKNVFAYKMQALVLGGVIGGFAGIVLALNQAAITPDQFLPQLTFYAYAVLIMGGAATVMGPVVGAVVFWFLLSAVERALLTADVLPTATIGPARLSFVGVLLVALMVFRPQGILGSKREMVLDA